MFHRAMSVLFALLACCVPGVVAWGGAGHMATAKLAQSLFTPAATAMADRFLPEVLGQIDAIASWADDVRRQPGWGWTSGLHFADTPDFRCHYVASRDCAYEGVDGACVDGAVHNYTQRLLDASIDNWTQYREALEFLVHFVGDLHQVRYTEAHSPCRSTLAPHSHSPTGLTSVCTVLLSLCMPALSATAAETTSS